MPPRRTLRHRHRSKESVGNEVDLADGRLGNNVTTSVAQFDHFAIRSGVEVHRWKALVAICVTVDFHSGKSLSSTGTARVVVDHAEKSDWVEFGFISQISPWILLKNGRWRLFAAGVDDIVIKHAHRDYDNSYAEKHSSAIASSLLRTSDHGCFNHSVLFFRALYYGSRGGGLI